MIDANTLNSIGLAFDILGAWLVAFEVMNQYKGKQYLGKPLVAGGNTEPVMNKQFIKWEKRKYYVMRFGLAFLTLGFSLQILSNHMAPCLDVIKNSQAQLATVQSVIQMQPAISAPIVNRPIPTKNQEQRQNDLFLEKFSSYYLMCIS